MNNKIILSIIISFLFCSHNCLSAKNSNDNKATEVPRIINIVNFIRQSDYRLDNAEELLYSTVEKQIELVNKYDFPATFLFQYDALIEPRYQKLMKTKLKDNCEIGAWWEITQPHVEAAGLKWRGEHSWVSTANIAFTPGYTQKEREKLVDVYFNKFKEIFGYYPKSVGSWFIDSYTLQYMYDKYGIVASCNCKDQVGTDGYTLWGGYWNQAYYPSKKNAYMPAQNEDAQVDVPIFRMLGSDPIYQYENGVGTSRQGVVSLEPVYKNGGGNKEWINYFLKSIIETPCLAFNYAQAGQENSFTWDAMKDGLEIQFAIFDSLQKQGEITIERLEDAGKWFKKNFNTTPATAVTTLEDFKNEGNKSIWYNSRYYRASLFLEKGDLYFRDIHLFDENLESPYFNTPGTGNQFFYYTLPVVDRFHWSTPEDKVGLKIVQFKENGTKEPITINDIKVKELSNKDLLVIATDNANNVFSIICREDKIEVDCIPSEKHLNWNLELSIPASRIDSLPFKEYGNASIAANFKGFNYNIICDKGTVNKVDSKDFALRFIPKDNQLLINCKTN